jgi:protein tyrosine phosphatase
VHCSAGVGRTGTFMMMALIRLLITNNQQLSVFNEVRKMREQRWGMVHTSSQYEYIYEFTEREINKQHSGVGGGSSESEEEEEGKKEI